MTSPHSDNLVLENEAEPAAVQYQLRVSQDKVTVVLDCPDPLADLPATVDRIMADFGRLEIPVFPDSKQLTKILQKIARPDCPLEGAPIIMGQNAIASVDGKLDWSRDYFTEGWVIDEESGNINFWEKLENCSVNKDDLLVKLLHPIPGEPGLNVFGVEIPVIKPSAMKLRCGKGVRLEEQDDGVAYYSNLDGRIRYKDSTLMVDDVYLIQGNVSLATGNIHHAGSVQIQGDVAAGATIDAEGDVMIKGMADPCTISCGGTLTIAGGLLGDLQHQISVGGDFNAKYVNEAHITVVGNVTIANEIIHSEIRAGGRVQIPNGRVAGGLVQGYQGVRVGQAGASGSSETTLISGIDFGLELNLASIEETIIELEETQAKIQSDLENMREKEDLKDPAIRRAFEGLKAKAKQQGRTIADQFAQIRHLTQQSKENGVMEVVIFQGIFTGTRIQLGEFHTVVKTTIEKPRIAQMRGPRVRVLPLGEGNMPTD